MKTFTLIITASLTLPLLAGCTTKEKKSIVYKNDLGEYAVPKEEKKGIFYAPPDVPGTMDSTNRMSADKIRAKENGWKPNSSQSRF